MPATILRSLPVVAWPEASLGAAKQAAGNVPMLGTTCGLIALRHNRFLIITLHFIFQMSLKVALLL
jgi:hypothetical protein